MSHQQRRNDARSGDRRAVATDAAKKKKKTSGFILDLKYRNDLPTPPVEPKFIKIPWNAEKLYSYHISSLEQHYKYRVHVEPNVGPVINLIDPSTAEVQGVRLQDADKHLIRRENDELQDFYKSGNGENNFMPLSTFGNTMSMRNLYESSKIRLGKHWLRKTEYIDNNQFGSIHNYPSGLMENQKRLAELEKEQRRLAGNSERKTKAERIEDSFTSCKKIPVHSSNPSLKPVKVFNIVPNMELVANPLFHIHFLDENILEDTNKAGGEKGKKRKRTQSFSEYTEEQVVSLGAGILEQVHEDEDNTQISLMIPADASENLEPSQERPGSIKTLKWVRDYEYQTQMFRPCERFAFVWDRSALDAPVDPNDIVYSKVRFADFVESRLEMRRTQNDKYNLEASRKKRIKLERRPYSEQEKQEHRDRKKEYEEGYVIGFAEEEEETNREAAASAKKVGVAKKSVNFKDKEVSSPSGSSSNSEEDDDEEEELQIGEKKDAPAEKAGEVAAKKDDDVSDSESGSSDSESD